MTKDVNTVQENTDYFSHAVLNWYDLHGRKDLPWKKPLDAYRIWVSEIMLQQTQVKTVIPYFLRFTARFPNLPSLAQAKEDEVLSLWSGLGYYSRARNLHKTAQIIMNTYQGIFPESAQALEQLPGIGASTAAAIVSQAFDQAAAILDGNVKRVLCRYFKVSGAVQKAAVHQHLLSLANACLPKRRFADYSQAIMDLGATCCTLKNPGCAQCPLQRHCQAFKEQVVLEYPNKTVRKLRPEKREQFLLVHHGNHQVLLEKRPEQGLWASLWCLPSIACDDCPKRYAKTYLNAEHPVIADLMSFKHSFTHFHLHIEAKSIGIDSQKKTALQQNQQWFNLTEISSLGIAKPTKKILQQWATTNRFHKSGLVVK